MMRVLRLITLLFSLSLGCLASGSQSTPYNLKQLVKPIDSLNWLNRVSQYWHQLLYRLGPDYAQLLTALSKCNSEKDAGECIDENVNTLFINIMKSGSSADKVKALQAVDRSLNNATAFHLISSHCSKVEELPNRIKSFPVEKKAESAHFNNFKDISSTTDSLSIEKIRPIDRDSINAKTIIATKYSWASAAPIDASAWFLLTQLEFYESSLWKLKKIADYINYVIKSRIILRADVDIVHLFDSIKKTEKWTNWIRCWHGYIVENSPFKKSQSRNDTKNRWKSISKSLILKDPKLAADTLGVNFPIEHCGARNYLLFLQDNPAERLKRLDPSSISEMYSCFMLVSSAGLPPCEADLVRQIPKEKYAELGIYLRKFVKNELSHSMLVAQLELPYLNIVSLFGNQGTTFNIDYARAFAQLPKTLELLSVIGNAKIGFDWLLGKPFNEYLLERLNWDDAIEEHFHFLISKLMINNYEGMARGLVEYIGISVHKALSIFKDKYLSCVDFTLEKVPRHLASYLEIIDEQTKQRDVDPSKRLEIAIRGSMINDEITDAAFKGDFVHYQLKEFESLTDYLKSPVFVDLARMHSKGTSGKIDEIKQFLHFKRLACKYFSDLPWMDFERGFQRLQANNAFSIALKAVIEGNFKGYKFPFALECLQNLEKELLKHNLDIAMKLQKGIMSKMMLLKAIYITLATPSSDLKFTFSKYIFNAQLLHKGIA